MGSVVSSENEGPCPPACREGHTYSGSCVQRAYGPDPTCVCGCLRSAHMGFPRGCQKHGFHLFDLSLPHARATQKPKGSEPSSSHDPCRCGHIAFRHQRSEEADTHCDHPSCKCTAYAKRQEGDSAMKTVELPKPCTCGPDEGCGDPCDAFAEPPMTPEEEEEAPPDEERCERCKGSAIDPEDSSPGTIYGDFPEPPALEPCRACQFPPPEGPEYTPCLDCGHIEPDHDLQALRCQKDGCGCRRYRPAPESEGPPCSEIEGCDGNCCAKAPPPPQPDRRPPYAVAYSVQGHLYEVAVSGDATIHAVDGALVIQHALGPVAGITGVLPVVNGESA